MNLEFSFIASILLKNDIKNFLDFNENELKNNDVRLKFEFIRRYFKKYNKVPTIKTIENEFNDEFTISDEKLEDPRYYADKILDNNNREKFLILSKKIAELSSEGEDLDKIRDIFNHNIKKIKTNNSNIQSGNIGRNAINRLKKYEDKKYEVISGFNWGFKNCDNSPLDDETPLVGGRLYLIQARPGIGKTFLCCALASNLVKKQIKTLFVSKEMSVDEVLERSDSFASGISYSRLKRGLLSENETLRYKSYLEAMEGKEYLEVKHPLRCTQETIKQFIEEEKPQIIFVDYLQLLKDTESGFDKRTQMENIIYDLKAYSQQYKIPIICISATNRNGIDKKSNDKNSVPDLENIAASDSIGYAVDVVFSLFQREEDEILNVMNLKCVKNRHGKKFGIKLLWDIDNSIIKENKND